MSGPRQLRLLPGGRPGPWRSPAAATIARRAVLRRVAPRQGAIVADQVAEQRQAIKDAVAAMRAKLRGGQR